MTHVAANMEVTKLACGHPMQCLSPTEWGEDSCGWCEEIEQFRQWQQEANENAMRDAIVVQAGATLQVPVGMEIGHLRVEEGGSVTALPSAGQSSVMVGDIDPDGAISGSQA